MSGSWTCGDRSIEAVAMTDSPISSVRPKTRVVLAAVDEVANSDSDCSSIPDLEGSDSEVEEEPKRLKGFRKRWWLLQNEVTQEASEE